MNTREEEDGYFFHKCFSKFRNVRIFVIAKYLRIKNLNKKSHPYLKLRYGDVYNF